MILASTSKARRGVVVAIIRKPRPSGSLAVVGTSERTGRGEHQAAFG
ncbi:MULTISPECIES: hypothetical protein [unclassified Bradyrhizobium]|nr:MULTISPECIES: hypothetical protein [unclassified Bradyrhizobium]MCK1708977.1 hypothetical protein [Bradyrhizobium sp. 143]MCK1724323.1 hypothetical protein [Bradyrhizobium sp. 142]